MWKRRYTKTAPFHKIPIGCGNVSGQRMDLPHSLREEEEPSLAETQEAEAAPQRVQEEGRLRTILPMSKRRYTMLALFHTLPICSGNATKLHRVLLRSLGLEMLQAAAAASCSWEEEWVLTTLGGKGGIEGSLQEMVQHRTQRAA